MDTDAASADNARRTWRADCRPMQRSRLWAAGTFPFKSAQETRFGFERIYEQQTSAIAAGFRPTGEPNWRASPVRGPADDRWWNAAEWPAIAVPWPDRV